jgi:hypothetical protein
MLERDGFAYRPSDIQMIAVLAVGNDIDAVRGYASRRNLFAELDRVMARDRVSIERRRSPALKLWD